MSSEPAIQVCGVSKVFRVYARPHYRLMQWFVTRRKKKLYAEFRALNDIGLEVSHGETVGIIGKNGSGKSTLLQIICGTLQPTAGEIKVDGRVAALLELGAGFNPDFTGRENVFLNGSVLGLSRREITERFDAIVRFADIGDFINQPVKTYSSGMYVRLAFAVAINSDPRILVVDEALSVGDEAFQRKCFSRIDELKSKGCTVLFVSHSAGAIVQLCDRAVLLDQGQLLMDGKPKEVVAAYQRLLYAPVDRRETMREELLQSTTSGQVEDEALARDGGCDGSRPVATEGTLSEVKLHERYDEGMKSASCVDYAQHGARIIEPYIVNAEGERVNVLIPGQRYTYRYRVIFTQPAYQVSFGMMIKSLTGVELFGMSSHEDGTSIDEVKAGGTYDVQFHFLSRFLPGAYFMNAGCNGRSVEGDYGFLHRIVDADLFKIEGKSTARSKAGFFDLADEPACRFHPMDA